MSSTVSALLRDLVKLILDFRTEIAWEFGERHTSAFLELLSAKDHKAVKQFHGGHNALLEAGDYEVDSEGERRRPCLH